MLELAAGRGGRPAAAQERMMGLTLLRITVFVPERMGERRRLRRVQRGAEQLRRAGVRRVLTAAGFPYWEALRAAGLRPVETDAFCQNLAPRLALEVLDRENVPPGDAVVTLSGPRVTRPLVRTAQLLCPKVRYLCIDVEEGGRELADWLRAEYGAAVLKRGGTVGGVTLCFGPGGHTPTGPQLRLYGAKPELAGLRPVPREGALPREWDELPLLALLWEEGRLPAEKIQFCPAQRQQLT